MLGGNKSKSLSSTHPACPVNQVVQLGDDILALAAGYRCWFGCCHCRTFLSDGNHTATKGRRRCCFTMCRVFTRHIFSILLITEKSHLVVVFSLLALLCRFFCWTAKTEMGLLCGEKVRGNSETGGMEINDFRVNGKVNLKISKIIACLC